MLKNLSVLMGAVVALLAACGGGSDDSSANLPSAPPLALSTIIPSAPASVCPAGGMQVDTGTDHNGSGTLDADEITNTTYVCNDAESIVTSGTLIDLKDEPPGENCRGGGVAIVSGSDQDRDGILSPSEVASTKFVCNSVEAGDAALIVTTAAPAKLCSTGGVQFDAGVDKNRNGVLDASEITSTSYVCHGGSGSQGYTGAEGAPGAPGLNSLIDIQPEPAGANCALGGTAIKSGLDTDRNGVLSAREVTSTRYICDSSSGAGDVIPPVISTTAPAVASSNRQSFTTSYSDNVELAYVSGLDGKNSLLFISEGVNVFEMEYQVAIPLGATANRVLMAADTSGNISKKNLTITTPKTGVALGNYLVVGEVVVPEGFDCYPNPYTNYVDDGTPVRHVSITSSEIWSTAEGYWPTLSIGGSRGNPEYSPSFYASAGGTGGSYYSPTIPSHPISAISLKLEGSDGSSGSGSGGSYVIRHKATVDPVVEKPGTVSITITRSCAVSSTGFPNGVPETFVDGVPMVFQASFDRSYYEQPMRVR